MTESTRRPLRGMIARRGEHPATEQRPELSAVEPELRKVGPAGAVIAELRAEFEADQQRRAAIRTAVIPGSRPHGPGQLPPRILNPLTPLVRDVVIDSRAPLQLRDWQQVLATAFGATAKRLDTVRANAHFACQQHGVWIANVVRMSRSRDLGSDLAALQIGAETGSHDIDALVASGIVARALTAGGAR